MRLLFAAASFKVVAGILAAGAVITVPTPAPALPTWYYASLLVIFQLSGSWLFIGGRRDQRARSLATVFVLFATLFVDRVLMRAATIAPGGIDRALEFAASVMLVAFCPFALWRFVHDFPRPQPAGPAWVGPLMMNATLLTGALLVAGNLIAWLPASGHPALAAALAWTTEDGNGTFWASLAVLTIGCVWLLIVKWRRAERVERRRLSWVVFGIAAGTFPMVAHALLTVTFPPYAALTDHPDTLRALGVIFTLFTLIIPVATAYAVVEEQALDVSWVVRRAVQYALAKYTVMATIAGLAIAVAVIAYGNRERPLTDLVADSPIAVAVLLLLSGLLMTRRALLKAIDRRFFRDQYDAQQILVKLAEQSASMRSSRDITDLLVSEVQRALHLERVALLTIDESGDTLTDSRGHVRSISLGGTLGIILSGSRAPLDVDLSSPGSALARLPEGEREWLADAAARLIVPLFGVRDTPLGLLVLGDKRSELPFTGEDRRLMTAVAASAALALEQQLNRESPDLDTTVPAPRGNGAECLSCHRVQARPAVQCRFCGGALRDALLPVVLAGKFEIERQIGAGGMGVVYRGRDLALNRPVAVKVLPRVAATAAARLRREARAMAALQHVNLAAIHVMESWRGAPVLVIEFLAGGTLADRIDDGPLPASDALAVFAAVTEGLRHIHDAGYLHRDIKPSNLGFAAQGTAKLLDFGLVHMMAEVSLDSTIVLTGGEASGPRQAEGEATVVLKTRSVSNAHFVGTPAYMSPEAVASEPPNPLVDLWSLAVTLYEAVTGTNPFRGTSMAKTIALVKAAEVPDARRLRPDCPAAVAAFLSTALARDRHRRPQTADEFLARLQAAGVADPQEPPA